MKVECVGINRYVAREGVVEIQCHVEKYQGIRQLWIDNIIIHGSVESSTLIIRLRKLRDYFRKELRINIL